MPPTNRTGEEPILGLGTQAIGQAIVSSDSVLTGREVDDDTLRFQELGEEVSKLVESDPEGTAALLRRWVVET
jgi:flagellar biosynthesis/type III secretory pathway M-ring protein FliF/YscJ